MNRPTFLAAALACACDGSALDVGSDVPFEAGAAVQPADGTLETGAAQPLVVAIDPQESAGCAQPCVQLAARVSGGTPPYAYQWSANVEADGGSAAICPSAEAACTVTVTDSSGKGGEFPVAAMTASATITVAAAAACGVDAAAGDAGAFVYWADWQSVDGGAVVGILSPPSGTVQVVYGGALYGAQTTTGTDEFTPSATFTSATVLDPPPGPGMIEVSGGGTQIDTLTFSQPVTDPVLAIYSLGTGYSEQSASLVFSAPFAVLSSGPNSSGTGYWGTEMLVPVEGGVSGVGGNGLVELEGTFSSIQWSNPNDTPFTFTGLTVGIRSQP